MKINLILKKISEKIKHFGTNNDNELLIIGLITILIAIWIILYLIPNIFVNLFNTFLGKAILILFVILVSFKNLYYGMILLFTFIIIYRFITLSSYSNYYQNQNQNQKEGFTWNQGSTNKFLEIQKLINPQIVFNAPEIQKQATQKEVDHFNDHGQWPWSDKVKKLYKESLNNNPYVRTSPEDAINTISTIYNEKAILQMLSWQTKEGQFLLNGVSINTDKKNPYEDLPNGWGDYAYNSKQISKNNNVIKCGYKNGAKSSDNSGDELSLQEIEYKGNDGIVYNHVKKISPVDYNNLEKLIPGFSFLKGPCNPCEALKNPPNYNCPFELNIRGTQKGVSPIWDYLWKF
jgi:hypothetical protein